LGGQRGEKRPKGRSGKRRGKSRHVNACPKLKRNLFNDLKLSCLILCVTLNAAARALARMAHCSEPVSLIKCALCCYLGLCIETWGTVVYTCQPQSQDIWYMYIDASQAFLFISHFRVFCKWEGLCSKH
jgi:hypothetical protein